MRAITLWQPWATAIAIGSKRVETRSWSTKYRGPLVIHAAKRCVVGELLDLHCRWNWQGAMRAAGWDWGNKPADYFKTGAGLPLGALVCVADLVDCRPTGSFTLAEITGPRRHKGATTPGYEWTEQQMGDFSAGRFGWVLENVRPFLAPIPFKGAQGFFQVPDELILEGLK